MSVSQLWNNQCQDQQMKNLKPFFISFLDVFKYQSGFCIVFQLLWQHSPLTHQSCFSGDSRLFSLLWRGLLRKMTVAAAAAAVKWGVLFQLGCVIFTSPQQIAAKKGGKHNLLTKCCQSMGAFERPRQFLHEQSKVHWRFHNSSKVEHCKWQLDPVWKERRALTVSSLAWW